MDIRLVAPLDREALVAVAGLATGYGFAAAHYVTEVEIRSLGDYPDPVALATRLCHRVLEVGRDDGTDPVAGAALAGHLLAASSLSPVTCGHAREVLEVVADAGAGLPWLCDRYLDPAAADRAGYGWMDLIDGACAALRASIVAVTGRPLGESSAGALLARGAALTLPR